MRHTFPLCFAKPRVQYVVPRWLLWFVILACASSCIAQGRPGPELVVAALPDVGTGWLDTLRTIAGDAAVDTLPFGKQVYVYGTSRFVQVGWYNDVDNVVYVHPDTAAYRKIRKWCPPARLCHPAELMVPAGVVAHEFGHRFQVSLWPHGAVREYGDSLPTWAQGDPEVFADRFGIAVMALRGHAANVDDSILNRVVRARLQASSTHTIVRDTSVTNQLRAHWRNRMEFMASRIAVCVSGHWRDADTTFVIDSLSRPAKHCGLERYQGILGFLELDDSDTYASLVRRWKLYADAHLHCLFVGAVVGLTPEHRPILWGYQRRDDVGPIPGSDAVPRPAKS